MASLRKVTTRVAKRSVVAAAKAATMGILDLGDAIEGVAADFAGETSLDLVEAFQKESEQLEKFRRELDSVVGQLSSAGKKETLIFFIDELDRCRPTFAVELLERIKHLFDVPNIVFVLSVDMRQLRSSVSAVYGQGIDGQEYLRKLIDLEFGLPPVKGEAFTTQLISKFGLDEIFALRVGRDLQYDRSNFIRFFSQLADMCGMSLRVRERCILRLKVVLDQTPANHHLDPILVALLIVLRVKEPELFTRIAHGLDSPTAAMTFLKELPTGSQFVAERMGLIIESLLMDSDSNRDRRDAALKHVTQMTSVTGIDEVERRRFIELDQINRSSSVSMRMSSPSIKDIAAKIDIAAGIRQ